MRNLSSLYPVWLCDVWGVVHNGVEPFADAVNALTQHRANGGTVILITNAPRLAGNFEQQLYGLGVSRTAWDAVVTSGDVTQDLLAKYSGETVYHLGPERDLGIFVNMDVRRGPLTDAKVVLCTGLFDDTRETPDDYVATLEQMLASNLTMICANPDTVVRRGAQLVYCAGALAERYSATGGSVVMAGKPFEPIYDFAIKAASQARGKTVEKAHCLAIGDGPETDVRGAANNGIDCVLVGGGVSDERLSIAALERNVRLLLPHAKIVTTMRSLRW
jgi:HAD superfamily hydrolase (TIGR01459 family)